MHKATLKLEVDGGSLLGEIPIVAVVEKLRLEIRTSCGSIQHDSVG